jgi:predicted nucleic acid-binding protein
MTFLIDTNIISEIMKKKAEPRVWHWFSELQEIHLSAVTVDEVFYGLTRKRMAAKAAWFQHFITEKAVIIGVKTEDARWCGEKRAENERSGHPGTMADYLIAAAAHRHGHVLATRNIKNFQHCGIALFNPFDAHQDLK